MISIQHAALYYLALYSKRNSCLAADVIKLETEFKDEVPFVVLPDGIRIYSGPRQISHFECTPDGNDVSFIKFPSEEVLKKLTKESFKSEVEFYHADGYLPCVIGEKTDIREFDRHNFAHKHYHALRVHMFQDAILDEVLRKELIDASLRFNDVFTVRHDTTMKIDGNELSRQVAEFERIGFIMLAGVIYNRTGSVLNNEWFKAVIEPALYAAYPAELAENTFKYMKLDDETNARITNLQFDITDDDKAKVPMAKDLVKTLNEMYVEAYFYTRREL
jgi:hypothetical protein